MALTVRYVMSGTATNGTDYTRLRGTVSVPAGATQANITVRATNDVIAEPTETAILTLSANPAYTIGAPNTGTVNIVSNE
jgi:hypothetical protein